MGGVNMTRHGTDTVMDDFIPNSFHIEESKSLVDLQKEQIILMLKNYGGVNEHKVKAGVKLGIPTLTKIVSYYWYLMRMNK